MRRVTIWVAAITLLGCILPGALPAWAAPPKGKTRVGDQTSGLPGLATVGAPVGGQRGVRIASAAGYALTESVGRATGPHHRLDGSLALGAVITPWLQLAGRLDGRVDLHPNDPTGPDSGAVGDPRLLARIGTRATRTVAVGAELGAWVPGGNAPSFELDATTVDAAGLLSWNVGTAWTLMFRGGYRLDNSARSIESPDRLSPSDRLALGLSDSNAVLAGLGADFRRDRLELFGEISGNLLVGSNAPAIGESPLRVAAGARYHVSPALQLGATARVSVSTRPNIAPGAPLVPVEPRAGALLSAVYRFGATAPAASPAEPTPEPPPGSDEPERIEEAPAEAVEKPAGPTPVVVHLADGSGKPVDKAWVRIETPGGEPMTLQPTSDPGTYRARAVPPGEATLVVTADGFADVERPTRFSPSESGEPMKLEIELAPASSSGQIRGLIRSFAGEPIPARIEIAPSGKTVSTEADGTFTIDVRPGTYTVTIVAPGYRNQTRRVRVEHDAVVVLNAELVKSR